MDEIESCTVRDVKYDYEGMDSSTATELSNNEFQLATKFKVTNIF